MRTGQTKAANKAEQKAPQTAAGLESQRLKILLARKREPHAIREFGFKGAQVLLARSDEKETGNGFRTDAEKPIPNGGILVKEIKVLIERMVSEGKSVEGILEEKGLSEKERLAFYAYVWRKTRITQEEAAKTMGITKVTLTNRVKSIANKLLGVDSYYHLIKRYVGLSDHELEIKIRETGVKSKVELGRKSQGLYRIAKKRGILDEMFPPPWLKELRNILEKALQERSLEEILADYEDLGRNIINEMALSKAPPSIKAFARKHELKPDKVARRIKKLVKQLKGEEVGNGNASNRLKECIENLDRDKLTELESLLEKKELALLERRAIPKAGESLESIGKTFSVTRQRMKQKEDRLVRKIERWKQGGKFERKSWEGARIKKIRKMIETRHSNGEPIDEIKKNSGLDETEGQLTDLYVLNENRPTQKEAAEKLGVAPSTISMTLKSVEHKLSAEEEIF